MGGAVPVVDGATPVVGGAVPVVGGAVEGAPLVAAGAVPLQVLEGPVVARVPAINKHFA